LTVPIYREIRGIFRCQAAPKTAETILRQIMAGADQKVSRAAFRGSLFVDGDGAPKSRN
jgi:hypothetical protein